MEDAKTIRPRPGRPRGIKYVETITFRAEPGFATNTAAFAEQVGESQSEYIRTAIEQRNKREAKRRKWADKLEELR